MLIDLCSGVGGWLVGVEQDHLGIEISPDPVATSRAAGHCVLRGDITTLAPMDCEGLVGSPPCQGFSAAGLRRGRNDPRSSLIRQIARWAQVRPTYIAVEQVQAARSSFGREAALLTQMGYKVRVQVLHSECYGVPQARARLVLMAHLDRVPQVPPPTHSRFYPHQPTRLDPGVLPWVSMADALGWGIERPSYVVTAGGTERGGGVEVFGHEARKGMDRVGFARKGDIDGEQYRERDLRPVTEPSLAVTSKARSWTRQRPAPTMVSEFRPMIAAKPAYRTSHSRQDEPDSVRLTVAQVGILQGFPPDYPWTGSPTSAYRQAGNAIPPPLASAVLAQLRG